MFFTTESSEFDSARVLGIRELPHFTGDSHMPFRRIAGSSMLFLAFAVLSAVSPGPTHAQSQGNSFLLVCASLLWLPLVPLFSI